MLHLHTIYSGSSGNCTAVCGDGVTLLIDAGRSARYTENALGRMGISFSAVDALFITHEHSDHIGGVEMLSKKYGKPVHVTAPSAARFIVPGSYTADAAVVHEPVYRVQVGSLTVESFPAEHDSAMNVGYVVTDADGEKCGVVTDLGIVTVPVLRALSGCREVVLESNHDVAMLENGPYPYQLKQRILSRNGHLCNTDCAYLALRLADTGMKSLTLAHLSRENNRPDIAYATTAASLLQGGFASVTLTVASADAV